jgi:hypothetical protein
MEHPYTTQLIQNLEAFYQGRDIEVVFYPNNRTIRLIVSPSDSLKEFAANLFNDLEKLPEIAHPREMVYFWMSQQGSADFYKELINPTKQAEENWYMIGTGPDTWVHAKDIGKY